MPRPRVSSRFFVSFILLCAIASGAIAQPAPLRVSTKGRALIDPSGRPVFLLADIAWGLALRMNRAEAGAHPRRGTWHRDGAETADPIAFVDDVRGGAGAPVGEFVPPTHGDGEDWFLILAGTEKL